MSTGEKFADQKAVTVAVSLLKRNNPKTIETLKNLLTFIPNPKQVSYILKTAVAELVYSCPHSVYWLFQRPALLEPELQVRESVLAEVSHRLITWGYTSKEFQVTSEQCLHIDDATLGELRSRMPTSSAADGAVITLILLLVAGNHGNHETLEDG